MRYVISDKGTYTQCNSLPKSTKETKAIEDFCSSSELFKKMLLLADKDSHASLLYSVSTADTFITAMDIIQEKLQSQEAPSPAKSVMWAVLFVASAVSTEADFLLQLPELFREIKEYAFTHDFTIESDDSIYCKPTSQFII